MLRIVVSQSLILERQSMVETLQSILTDPSVRSDEAILNKAASDLDNLAPWYN